MDLSLAVDIIKDYIKFLKEKDIDYTLIMALNRLVEEAETSLRLEDDLK